MAKDYGKMVARRSASTINHELMSDINRSIVTGDWSYIAKSKWLRAYENSDEDVEMLFVPGLKERTFAELNRRHTPVAEEPIRNNGAERMLRQLLRIPSGFYQMIGIRPIRIFEEWRNRSKHKDPVATASPEDRQTLDSLLHLIEQVSVPVDAPPLLPNAVVRRIVETYFDYGGVPCIATMVPLSDLLKEDSPLFAPQPADMHINGQTKVGVYDPVRAHGALEPCIEKHVLLPAGCGQWRVAACVGYSPSAIFGFDPAHYRSRIQGCRVLVSS